MNNQYFWPVIAALVLYVLVLYVLLSVYKVWIEAWLIGETFSVDEAGKQTVALMQRGWLHAKLRLVLKQSGRGWVEASKRIAKSGEQYIRIVIDEKGYSKPILDGIAESFERNSICFSHAKRKGRNILYVDIGWDEELASAIVKIALGEAMSASLHEEIRCKKKGVFKPNRI